MRRRILAQQGQQEAAGAGAEIEDAQRRARGRGSAPAPPRSASRCRAAARAAGDDLERQAPELALPRIWAIGSRRTRRAASARMPSCARKPGRPRRCARPAPSRPAEAAGMRQQQARLGARVNAGRCQRRRRIPQRRVVGAQLRSTASASRAAWSSAISASMISSSRRRPSPRSSL